MKQIKTIIAIAFFAILSFNNATAGKTEDNITALPVELKFVGTINTQHIFELSFAQTKSDYKISITDENGYVFFSDNYRGDSFKKQFLLNPDVLTASDVTFTITEKKSGKKVIFHVNQQTKVSEEMNIVKL